MIAITNESDFNIDNDKLVAVKFWASWCGPCKQMNPSIKKIEEEFPNVKFLSVEIEQVPEIAQRFRIKSLPSILLLKDGQEVKRINGLVLMDPLRKAFRDLTAGEE
jgi:thioredoxin 1